MRFKSFSSNIYLKYFPGLKLQKNKVHNFSIHFDALLHYCILNFLILYKKYSNNFYD